MQGYASELMIGKFTPVVPFIYKNEITSQRMSLLQLTAVLKVMDVSNFRTKIQDRMKSKNCSISPSKRKGQVLKTAPSGIFDSMHVKEYSI
jgi:hypothetical protein